MQKSLGIVLIVLGIVLFTWTSFTYTKKEKIIDIGPIQISADKEKSINWPPYVGGVILAVGIAFLITSKKN